MCPQPKKGSTYLFSGNTKHEDHSVLSHGKNLQRVSSYYTSPKRDPT